MHLTRRIALLATAALALSACGSPAPVTVVVTETAASSASPSASTPASPSTSPSTSPTLSPSLTPSTPVATSDLAGTNTGFIKSYDTSTGVVQIDVVYFYTGNEAKQQAAANQNYWGWFVCDLPDGSSVSYSGTQDLENCWLPNDYLIINDNPKLRDFTFAPGASINLIDWTNCCSPKSATPADLTASLQESPSGLLGDFTVNAAGQLSDFTGIFTP